jgi:hypothetical protein
MAASGTEGNLNILIPELADGEKGVFRRIGLAFGWGEDVKVKILPNTLEGENFPWVGYRNGMHSICII